MSDSGITVPMQDFSDVKVGDTVIRMLAGLMEMEMLVTEVDDRLIHCSKDGVNGWTFDRKTGVEEDELLGWGVASMLTGSFLTAINVAAKESDS